MTSYICNICGADYKTEALKQTCEKTPVEPQPQFPIGTVFECNDGLLGILYKNCGIQQQTHNRTYMVARADPDWLTLDDGLMIIVSGVMVDATYLSEARPIDAKLFDKVKQDFDARTKNLKIGNARELAKFVLTPLQ